VGGRNGRPVLFERKIRSARRAVARLTVLQNEVRLAILKFCLVLLCPQKRIFAFF
jgi:hypothetical protein